MWINDQLPPTEPPEEASPSQAVITAVDDDTALETEAISSPEISPLSPPHRPESLTKNESTLEFGIQDIMHLAMLSVISDSEHEEDAELTSNGSYVDAISNAALSPPRDASPHQLTSILSLMASPMEGDSEKAMLDLVYIIESLEVLDQEQEDAAATIDELPPNVELRELPLSSVASDATIIEDIEYTFVVSPGVITSLQISSDAADAEIIIPAVIPEATSAASTVLAAAAPAEAPTFPLVEITDQQMLSDIDINSIIVAAVFDFLAVETSTEGSLAIFEPAPAAALPAGTVADLDVAAALQPDNVESILTATGSPVEYVLEAPVVVTASFSEDVADEINDFIAACVPQAAAAVIIDTPTENFEVCTSPTIVYDMVVASPASPLPAICATDGGTEAVDLGSEVTKAVMTSSLTPFSAPARLETEIAVEDTNKLQVSTDKAVFIDGMPIDDLVALFLEALTSRLAAVEEVGQLVSSGIASFEVTAIYKAWYVLDMVNNFGKKYPWLCDEDSLIGKEMRALEEALDVAVAVIICRLPAYTQGTDFHSQAHQRQPDSVMEASKRSSAITVAMSQNVVSFELPGAYGACVFDVNAAQAFLDPQIAKREAAMFVSDADAEAASAAELHLKLQVVMMVAKMDVYHEKVNVLKRIAKSTKAGIEIGINVGMPLDTDSLILGWGAINAAHDLVMQHPELGVEGSELQSAACGLVKVLISAEAAVCRLPAFAEKRETSSWGWVSQDIIPAIEKGEKIWFLDGLNLKVDTIIKTAYETVNEQMAPAVVVVPAGPGSADLNQDQPLNLADFLNFVAPGVPQGVESGELGPLRMGPAGSLMGGGRMARDSEQVDSGVTSGESTPRSARASVLNYNKKYQEEKTDGEGSGGRKKQKKMQGGWDVTAAAGGAESSKASRLGRP